MSCSRRRSAFGDQHKIRWLATGLRLRLRRAACLSLRRSAAGRQATACPACYPSRRRTSMSARRPSGVRGRSRGVTTPPGGLCLLHHHCPLHMGMYGAEIVICPRCRKHVRVGVAGIERWRFEGSGIPSVSDGVRNVVSILPGDFRPRRNRYLRWRERKIVDVNLRVVRMCQGDCAAAPKKNRGQHCADQHEFTFFHNVFSFGWIR
jgi:hypothetical protein